MEARVTDGRSVELPPAVTRSPWAVPRWTEPAIHALGRSQRLNDVGRWLGATFHRFFRAGRAKDVVAGTWMGHPAHPMLTDITIGAWASAAILDIAGGRQAGPAAQQLVAMGILSAVPTTITGLSDLTDIVEREVRSVATAHALANVGGLLIWSVSYLARKAHRRGLALTSSMAGTVIVTAAGFLGGHLSFRKGVGVDQTTFEPSFSDWTPLGDVTEFEAGKPRRVEIAGSNVLVYRTPERIYALANRCTHRGGPLHKGTIDGETATVTCPWHLSTFRLRDGAVVRGPATAPQPSYEVRVRDGSAEIRRR